MLPWPHHEQSRETLALPHLCGPFHRRRVQPALPRQSGQGPDRPVHRLRPAHPDRLRQRPRAGARRSGQGGRARFPHRRHAHPAGRHSAGHHEHLDDHQCHGRLAPGALRGGGRRAGGTARQPLGHDAERHHQGISLARHLCLPAGALAEADHRHHRLLGAGTAQVEPDECLLLSPAGGGCHAGPGALLCAGHGHRRARRREGQRRGERSRVPAGLRPHLLLRQCRHPLHHRDVQDARLHRTLGRDRARALRHRRREVPPLPLWRAGEFAGPHRAAAREQRLPHPARDAGGGAVEERPRPRRAVAGLERGARPAQALGPAMVAAHAAGGGL